MLTMKPNEFFTLVFAKFQAQAEGKSSDDIVVELLKVLSEPELAKYLPKKK